MALMTTYLIIIALFCAPLAAVYFADLFFPNTSEAELVRVSSMTSPFAATFAVPLDLNIADDTVNRSGRWVLYGGYMAFSTMLVCSLLGLMVWMFHTRWRVAE